MADFEIANERVTPSLNDVNGGVAGDGVNAYEKFVAPWRKGFERSYIESGFVIPSSSGNLNIDIPLGVAIISGYRVNVPGSTTLTVTDAATNYIFLKLTRDGSNNVAAAKFEVNTSGTAPADSTLIAVAVAAGGAITSALDCRVLSPSTLASDFAPVSVAAGSTRSHEGAVVITANQNMSGVHFVKSLWIKSGITVTVPAEENSLVIIAESFIKIDGAITTTGAGALGGSGGGTNGAGVTGNAGTDQPGGGGGAGGGGGGAGGKGGSSAIHGVKVSDSSANPAQMTASRAMRLALHPEMAVGGAGGGGGGGGAGGGSGGAGGGGGGSIALIAPIVTIAGSAVLTTKGTDGGGASGGDGAGGGGGGGNVYVVVRKGQYTDGGATFTQTGGAGGAGSGGGGDWVIW